MGSADYFGVSGGESMEVLAALRFTETLCPRLPETNRKI
jgi:hypothetical protein